MTLSTRRLALSAAMVVGVLTGAAMTATRYLSADIGPGSMGFLRYALSSLCLLPVLFTGGFRFAWRDAPAVAALGTLQFGLLIFLLNYGVERMASGRAALLFATFPFMTMLLGAALGRERLTALKTAGVVLSLLGVALTLGERLLAETSVQEGLGAAAVLLAALCGASSTVLSQPLLKRYSPLSIAALATFSSLPLLAALAAHEGMFSNPPSLSASGWACIAFIGTFSAGGYILLLWALKHTTPTSAIVFQSLSPPVAAATGLIALGEPLTSTMLAGVAAVAAGLWLATRPAPPERNAP